MEPRSLSDSGGTQRRVPLRGQPRAFWLLAVLSILAAMPLQPAPSARGPSDNAPELRLEQVITSHADLGRGRFIRWLTGAPDQLLFSRPFDVDWSEDDLIVTDPGAGRVVRLRQRAKPIFSARDLFDGPLGIAACLDGIVVTDSLTGRVAMLGADLSLRMWILEGVDRPTGVACSGNTVFVVETGRHRVLSVTRPPAPASTGEDGLFAPLPSGERRMPAAHPGWTLRQLGARGSRAGQFNFPTAIAVGPGSLWIGDTLNFRVQRFDLSSGKAGDSFGQLGDAPGEMPRLKGLAIDNRGHVWTSDAYLNQLALYDHQGRFLGALGAEGPDPGNFSLPAGIAAHPDGRVAVVDSLNRRLQVFRISASTDNQVEPRG